MKVKSLSTRKGFTLVEILVVMAIIATLAGISFAVFSAVTRNSYDKVTKANIKAIDSYLDTYIADNPSIALPAGNGDENSTIALYKILTYDYDLDGDFDAADISAAASETPSIVIYEGEKPIYPNLLEKGERKKVSDTYQILDPMGHPLRYYHILSTATAHAQGKQNDHENGYDLWGAGEDGKTTSDPDTNPSKTNGMLDDITNWSDV